LVEAKEVVGDSMREFAQALDRDRIPVSYLSALLFYAEQLEGWWESIPEVDFEISAIGKQRDQFL
jgi:hypothetical protein